MRNGLGVKAWDNWYLQTPDGRYLAQSSEHDNQGSPFVTVVSERAAAIAFELVDLGEHEVDSYLVRLRDPESGRVIRLAPSGMLVLDDIADDWTVFTTRQIQPAQLRLSSSVVAKSDPDNIYLVEASRRFMVGTKPPTPMQMLGEPAEGNRLWSRRLAGAAVGGPAAFGEHQVVAGNPPLVCAQSLTGQVEWTFQGRQATSPAAVSLVQRTAVVASDEEIYAVSLDTGAGRWWSVVSGMVSAAPVLFEDTAYIVTNAGVLHALSLRDGAERWCYPRAEEARTPTSTSTSVALGEQTLYFGSGDGTVRAVNLNTGREIWGKDLGSAVHATPLLVDRTIVVVCTEAGVVMAMDAAIGAQCWVVDLGSAVRARPVVRDGVVLVGTTSGRVHSIDLATGAEAGSPVSVEGAVEHDLVLADGVAYVTAGHKLYALSAGETSDVTFPAQRRPAGPPRVFSGTVCTATTDGTQIAFTAGLRDGGPYTDLACYLRACMLADAVVDPAHRSAVPANWQLIATRQPVEGTKLYGTAAIFHLRRPSDDRPVLVIAFGVDQRRNLTAYGPAAATLARVPKEVGGLGSGMVNAQALADYQAIWKKIEFYTQFFKTATIVVTGQGWAGPLATLCALQLATRPTGPQPSCVTFGAPAPGDAEFATRCESRVPSLVRMVVPGDTVVDSMAARSTPGEPSRWEHAGIEVTMGDGHRDPVAFGSTAWYAQTLAGSI
ncbi:outer membrane protein assembly factor BamB family protein [Actinokineospora pegani]|uniref:outer membrane protein assembly factor BamB family protein n=1 Tax=Actinokineospora pegani TaxID=2654637 RepID=UPI0018D2A6E2|nr:PQQ-binding-like beta-propeller repeat protein [Actinokineospora pegani]